MCMEVASHVSTLDNEHSTCEHGGVGIGQVQYFLPDGGHFLANKNQKVQGHISHVD